MQRRPLVLVLSFLMAVAAQEQNLMREMAAQPNSGSYSQVRFSSTRRNGTYDPYSLASNPALANHRLVSASSPSKTPGGYTIEKMPSYGSQRPSAIEVQSAIQDSMRQQQQQQQQQQQATIHRTQRPTESPQMMARPTASGTPPPQESSFYGNYYPQYSDTFSGPTIDLQQLPSSSIQGSHEGEPEVHESSHHEMNPANGGVHDYHREVLNVTFSHPLGGNAATQLPLPEYDEEEEEESAQASPPGSDYVYGHTLHTSQQYIGDNPNEQPNSLDRRVDVVVPTTTDCGPTCQLFREEFRKSQMLMKTAKPPTADINALLHTMETKTSPPITTTQPLFPQNQQNFSAPATNEIFSISDALIPPVSAPTFQNASMNNAFPHPMPPNQFSPSQVFIGQGLSNPQIGPSSPLSLQAFAHLPSNMHGQQQQKPQQQIMQKPQQQQVMQNSPQQPQFMQHSPQPLLKNGPQPQLIQNGRPIQPIVIPAGSLPPGMSVFHQPPSRSGQQQQTQNRPVFISPQQFITKPSTSGSTMSPFRSPMVLPMPQMSPGPQVIHSGQRPTFQQPAAPQSAPPQGNGVTSIPGPMGIHIPIPPKSVPAHTVMAPPPGVFPQSMDGQHPPQPPPRRNGGFLDSIMNFFGGRNQNRARSLDDGGIMVLDDSGNYTIINGSLVNMTYLNEMFNGSLIEEEPTTDDTVVVLNGTDNEGILKRVRRSDLLENVSTELLRWFSRLREDSETLFERPIFPRLRRLIHDTFASRSENKTNESTKSNRRGNLWAVLLRTQEADSRPASEEVETQDQNDLSKKIQNLLLSRKSLRRNVLKLMNRVPKRDSISPNCALDGNSYCTEDNTYPTSLMSSVLAQVERVGANLKCNESTNASALMYLSFKKSNAICQTSLEKIRPLRAQNHLGFWKIIVNIPGICQQSVIIRKCKESCIEDNEAKNRKCIEQQMTRKLLAYDRRSGFHTDSFDFPSGCSCSNS